MDPDKSPHIPSGRPASSRSRMPSPPERVGLAPATGGPSQPVGRSQTTLPPIHHLHPGLAHTPMQPPPPPPPPPLPPQRAASPYMQGATYPLASTSTLGVRPAPDDSDPETSQGRQKQKRRRQALSCTECKRRKIKCDRANPCGPCVRRGEQAKCQWHVIEPMEKYVTRSEFDELKARVQELEAAVFRQIAGVGMGAPAPTARRPSMSATMPMTSGHPAEPVHGTAIMPYQAYGAPAPVPYPPRPASPRSPARGEPPPYYRHPASTVGRSPTIPYRPPPMPNPPPRAGAGLHLPPTASPRSPVRPVSPSVRTSPSIRRSSISLAEITAPYHAEPKPSGPKNRCAQTTPPPGPRLRPLSPSGPAPVPASPHLRIHIVDLRRRVPV
ncbi:hypothetical protein OH77DRAFT_63350 [Trametes cingulata]|nr:hypothetical protein OH77DRAFT_63350 [Trametes cingulata]